MGMAERGGRQQQQVTRLISGVVKASLCSFECHMYMDIREDVERYGHVLPDS